MTINCAATSSLETSLGPEWQLVLCKKQWFHFFDNNQKEEKGFSSHLLEVKSGKAKTTKGREGRGRNIFKKQIENYLIVCSQPDPIFVKKVNKAQ